MNSAPDDQYRVVCFGGSAGALRAYVKILQKIPADTGMAFVVAPHRGVDHVELLPQILGEATDMPVLDVQEGMQLTPNTVFVMPPRKNMTITGSTFRLRTIAAPTGWPTTINIFLLSMAEQVGPRTIAVIVSGLDHDGSAAMQAIKAAGGLTFAQSDASEESMPENAVRTGYVDYFLPAAEIGAALSALASSRPVIHHPADLSPK